MKYFLFSKISFEITLKALKDMRNIKRKIIIYWGNLYGKQKDHFKFKKTSGFGQLIP